MPTGTHRHPRTQRRARFTAIALVVGLATAAVVGILLNRPLGTPDRVATGAAMRRPPASTAAFFPHPAGPTPPTGMRTVPRPTIVWKPIPFGAKRERETAAYARLHYGISSWHLTGPHVIVEHFTASTTMLSAWNEFAHDVPDPEFHSLPATCAHFIVAQSGTIYQLVPLDVMCRHTVGLNWTAIGIEMVGTGDRQIRGDAAEYGAALRLTAWLASRYHVAIGNVIGHNESLESPYHRERVAAWRCQTHGDWTHPDMQVFRARVRTILQAHGVPPGSPWRARRVSGC
jgi:N-acetylmuramoyl-L-alanine amidase